MIEYNFIKVLKNGQLSLFYCSLNVLRLKSGYLKRCNDEVCQSNASFPELNPDNPLF
jgi:hypothetical protein